MVEKEKDRRRELCLGTFHFVHQIQELAIVQAVKQLVKIIIERTDFNLVSISYRLLKINVFDNGMF